MIVKRACRNVSPTRVRVVTHRRGLSLGCFVPNACNEYTGLSQAFESSVTIPMNTSVAGLFEVIARDVTDVKSVILSNPPGESVLLTWFILSATAFPPGKVLSIGYTA